jgi:protein SCO1/2
MQRLRTLRLVLWALVAVALAGAGWLYWEASRGPDTDRAPAGNIASIGGPFDLTDEDGNRFASASLAGKPFAIFFGFTQCPDVCPTTMLEMANVMQEVGDAARDFKVLFVTIDPERDKPDMLKAYTESFDARIIGLTGTAEEIAAVTRAYRAIYRKVPTEGGYTMDHTAIVFLMNAQGRLASTISYGEPHDSAVSKLKRLLAAN